MSFIPIEIDDDEILVRFIFTDHFRNKKVNKDKIIDQEVFLYSEKFGVSLQRSKYTDEQFCKDRAKDIENKSYTGFVVFTKEDYLKVFSEISKERKDFQSNLEFSPLFDAKTCYVNRKNINIKAKGNPSHCDIFYINPGLVDGEVNPKIPLRIFSRTLFKYSHLVIDSNSEKVLYEQPTFPSFFEV